MFIVFEGLDGSGKSTLIQGLSQVLEQQNISFHKTREPGGTLLGEEVRKLLLQVEGDSPVPRAELLLYEAIRAQHVEKLIKPKLAEKSWVLCDRYTASTFAFQAGGRGLTEEDINWLNAFATDQLEPDLWVLVDLPPQECQKRMAKRGEQGQEKDRFEQEELSFHEKVRNNYKKQSTGKSNWLVLDGLKKPDELITELVENLKGRKWLA